MYNIFVSDVSMVVAFRLMRYVKCGEKLERNGKGKSIVASQTLESPLRYLSI